MYPKAKVLTAARLAAQKQAENPVVLMLKKISSVCDYILICGASSERQVHAIALNIEEGLKARGERPLGTEGIKQGRWALLDYGDIIVHVFIDSLRSYYDIEGLWADAEVVELKPAKTKALKKA
ncbi:MAG: ribosome silencing factor [Thermodesulfobacteriota bacterium]